MILQTYQLDALIKEASQVVHTVVGQLTASDRMIYYWAAREYYTGQGTIVDAGALVGSTAAILGEGLRANNDVQLSEPVIFSYDLFEDDHDGYMSSVIKTWYPDYSCEDEKYDFLPLFERNTKEYSELVVPIKGDITEKKYSNEKDIEILSIDVAKSPDLMLHCAKCFFPRLIPGKSLVLHQDYIFSFNPWIAIAMEIMSDYFDKVYDAPDNCTAVFICKKKITEEAITRTLGEKSADYYNLNNVKYMYRVIEDTKSQFGGFVHKAALCYFYFQLGEEKTAIQVAQRMMVECSPTQSMIKAAAVDWFLRDFLKIKHPSLPEKSQT